MCPSVTDTAQRLPSYPDQRLLRLPGDPHRVVRNWLPQASIRSRHAQNHAVRFTYSARSMRLTSA